jgi:voltage-gated potassium channel
VESKKKLSGFRLRLHETIFEADTLAGKLFDITLLVFIIGSVLTIVLESVQSLKQHYGDWFRVVEWFFTIIFTLEYFARLWTVLNKRKYVFSFFGIIDLLSILPTYLAL